jgi:hypothetical protein
MMNEIALPFRLVPERLVGRIVQEAGDAPIPGATWYTAQAAGDGLVYRFPPGALAGAEYLTADMLLDGQHVTSFTLILQEGQDGPRFGLNFGLLNQCSARMRMPLAAVNQNRWRYEREGAWLKPRCRYDRVDLRRVDRMVIEVERKSDRPVRWCMTPVTVTAEEPPRLEEPILPQGPLLDELGQSTLHNWPAKSRTPEQVTERLRAQLDAAPLQRWPEGFSRWGGWVGSRVEATGFFRTHHDGQRWWLVDPDGYVFWSSGLDCVRIDTAAAYGGLESALTWMPDPGGPYAAIYGRRGAMPLINYLAAHFIRAFGSQEWYDQWAAIALAELRCIGFNTVANWSDWQIASDAGLPYVRHLEGRDLPLPKVYRDFPDVFDPAYPEVAAAYAETLRQTAGDAAMIGYFLMNEPSWGFAQETPAAGMLFNTPSCASRLALAGFLRERYGSDRALSAAWGLATAFDAVAEGAWNTPLTPAAQADLAGFSAVMVERFFGELSDACRAVDPHHLNLGVRYYTVPPAWALEGMRAFDVFSMNCYRPRLPADDMAQISAVLGQPILIGEWHFGALDVGLPASGIGHVPDQRSRGQAFRVYLEDAAAKPWCVGAHYFTLYDQSAIGRFDGESYNIGFLDVCNRPYEPLARAARASHERLYAVATGQAEPYGEEPEYLPLLFV